MREQSKLTASVENLLVEFVNGVLHLGGLRFARLELALQTAHLALSEWKSSQQTRGKTMPNEFNDNRTLRSHDRK